MNLMKTGVAHHFFRVSPGAALSLTNETFACPQAPCQINTGRNDRMPGVASRLRLPANIQRSRACDGMRMWSDLVSLVYGA